MTATEITVPRSSDWPVRNGCFARTTKAIPIAHAKGKAQAFPEFEIDDASWANYQKWAAANADQQA